MPPRTWKALPDPQDPLKLVKAPDFETYEDYADADAKGEKFRFPKRVQGELLAARSVLEALTETGVEVGQSQEYRIWRYNMGLGIETPSGWVLYAPFETSADGKRLREQAVAQGKLTREQAGLAEAPKGGKKDRPKDSPKVDPEGVLA